MKGKRNVVAQTSFVTKIDDATREKKDAGGEVIA